MQIYEKSSTFATEMVEKQRMAKRIFTRIVIWIGIMAVLTLIALGIWYIGWHGSQATESLKWLQFIQTLGTFLIPSILCAAIWDSGHKPFRWLNMDKNTNWRVIVISVIMMICAIPAINLLADLNSRIELPKSLDFIEDKSIYMSMKLKLVE